MFVIQVASSNSLKHLVSVTFDQCHGISASILFSELIDLHQQHCLIWSFIDFELKESINSIVWFDLFIDLVESENQLEMLSVWSCRYPFICTLDNIKWISCLCPWNPKRLFFFMGNQVKSKWSSKSGFRLDEAIFVLLQYSADPSLTKSQIECHTKKTKQQVCKWPR